jgi:hypothetical protein
MSSPSVDASLLRSTITGTPASLEMLFEEVLSDERKMDDVDGKRDVGIVDDNMVNVGMMPLPWTSTTSNDSEGSNIHRHIGGCFLLAAYLTLPVEVPSMFLSTTTTICTTQIIHAQIIGMKMLLICGATNVCDIEYIDISKVDE